MCESLCGHFSMEYTTLSYEWCARLPDSVRSTQYASNQFVHCGHYAQRLKQSLQTDCKHWVVHVPGGGRGRLSTQDWVTCVQQRLEPE